MNVEIVGKVDFFTDNKIVRDTILKGKHRDRLANHGDLWADIFEKIEQKGLEVKVYWMPSHTDTQPTKKEKAPEWMKDWHVQGNKAADELAVAAASLHEIPKEQADKIIKIYKDLHNIQNRIIEVTKMYPQRKYNKTILDNVSENKPTYKDQLLDLLQSYQHDCIIHNNRLHCSKCNSSIHIKATHIKDFISSSCLSPEETYCFAVGHQHTHHSHRMKIYGGVYMCTRCGGTGSRKLIKLARPCEAPTYRGQQNIDAYAAGTAPAGYKGWPYKKIHLQENISVNNVQTLVDRMHKKYKNEYEKPYVYDADDDSAFDDEPDHTDHTVEEAEDLPPATGGSESESD